ncbi:MAG TPA: DPP IV N-terminal domain-containing protein [Cyclobacteriaceae bacterium]|nr:DPP IV N-terminal domain-containing protein [Cyclobacteriaceae bacterium]
MHGKHGKTSRITRKVVTSLLFVAVFATAEAQGTLADYRRAETADTAYLNKVYNLVLGWDWTQNDTRFWYVKVIAGGKEFMLADPAKKTKAKAFDHQKLAKALSDKTKKIVNPKKLPFEEITFKDKGTAIEFVSDSVRWQCKLSSYDCKFVERLKPRTNRYWGSRQDEKSGGPVVSPDSLWAAIIRTGNVYIRNIETKEEFRLSNDGSEGEYYSTYMRWSPDSKKLMAYKVRPGESHLIYFVESSPANQVQPKLQSREYLKPGDALPIRMPQLFLVDERKHVKVSHEQFADQFNLTDFEWRKDSKSFIFEYNQRGHQRYKVIEVAAPSGDVTVLVDEQPKTFFDYAGKSFLYTIELSEGRGNEIVWMSERDGWNHLYLYDGKGNVKNQITKGEWVVRSVMHVDASARQITFTASGMDAGIDPYLRSVFRINFDGTGLTRLTEPGTDHTVTFSPDKASFFDISQRSDLPPTYTIRRASDGGEVMQIEKADPAALVAAGWRMPEVFVAKGRDGVTDIWGHILRPSNFDPNKKYPVIEYIYAGPHSNHVPKIFNSSFRVWQQLTELGFIIVQMDGMGTSNRSKAFHDVCWKNLKDAGFPDRILWIKEAAKTRPYMDITRVGIFGNSAGGQNSLGALLFHPDFYKVAVSSSGCHDNRMDKIWWNELWMSYPVGPQYAESSNVTHAKNLQGKLLLILGELDDNVDPASTMQVVDQLVKHKKNFDFIFVPGMGHSMGGEYGERRRRDFFVKHLLGVEPPSWQERYGM